MTLLEQILEEPHQLGLTDAGAFRVLDDGLDSQGQRHTRIDCWCGYVIDGEGTPLLRPAPLEA